MKNLQTLAGLVTASVYLDEYCGTIPKRFPPKPKWTFSFEALYEELALNPQPLPPFALATLIGRGLVELMNRTREATTLADEAQTKAIQGNAASALIALTGDCGTEPIGEILRRLLRRLDRHFPPIPDPDPAPWWSKKFSIADQFLIHSIVLTASQNFEGQIREQVGAFAAKNLEKNFKELG